MKPILAMTMGDTAGIGAECCVRAAAHRELYDWCRPLVVGDLGVLMQTVQGVGAVIEVRPVASPEEIPDEPGVLPVICETQLETGTWQYGVASAACGEASYQYICKRCFLQVYQQENELVNVAKYLKIKFLIVLKL